MLFTGASPGDIADAVAYTANWTLLDGSLDDIGEYIISGLVHSAGTGLAVNVTAGVASIGGRVTKASGFSIGSLTPSTTNHLYLNQDGTGTSNTTGTQPVLSVKLGTATTDGAGVTAVALTWAAGRMTRRRTENLVHGSGAGHPRALDLSSWHATNNEGNETKGTLPSTALPSNVFLKDSSQTLSDGVNVAVGSTTGTKLGTATTQKLGFFNATPIVQPANTTDLRAMAINLGFLASGGATPLDLNGGTFACSTISDVLTDSATSIESDMILLTHHSSGTPAAGFGTAIEFGGDDSANVNRKMGRVVADWLVATSGATVSEMVLKAANGGAFVTALKADGNQLVTVPGALLVNGPTGATVSLTDAGTTTEPTLLTIQHRSSGTPGVSFGSTLLYRADNSANALTNQLSVAVGWSAATAGAENSLVIHSIRRGGADVEVLRLTSAGNGRAQFAQDLFHANASGAVGFFNTTPVVKQAGASAAGIAAVTDANAKAALTAIQAALAAYGLVTSPA